MAKRKVSAKTKAKRLASRAEKAAKRAGKKVKRKAKPLGKKVKRGAKRVGKKAAKFAKTDTGRAGIGAGAGALLLGPVGAVAGAAAGLATRNPGGRKRNVSDFEPSQWGRGKPSKEERGSRVSHLPSPGKKLARAGLRSQDKARMALEDTEVIENPDPQIKVSSAVGNMLVDYHRASPAIEHLAASGIRGERVSLSIVKRARQDLQKLHKLQTQAAEREQIRDVIDALDRLIQKAERSAMRNPARAFSLDAQVGAIRRSKAKKYATGTTTRSKVYGEVKGKSLAAKLRQINPGHPEWKERFSTLDALTADYERARKRWMSASAKPGSSSVSLARAQRRMDDAENKLILYAEMVNLSPKDLRRYLEKRGQRSSKTSSRAHLNPLQRIPKGAGIRKIRNVVSANISAEMSAGKPQDQAVAIAIRSAQEDAKRIGGSTAKLIRAEYPRRNPKATKRDIKKMHRKHDRSLKGAAVGTAVGGITGAALAGPAGAAIGAGAGSYAGAKAATNPKKKKKATKKKRATTSESQRLIRRCQKLWEHYCERPGKSRLKEILKHLEKMEGHASKAVKDERSRCMRAAKIEAKKLKLKV